MDGTAHGEQTRSTLDQPFDGVVHVETADDGSEARTTVGGP